ncbi:hypothetical protein EWM64_g4727 [Hericium alpestre]|uniref:Uncharacterized protein n=1 Tax=Hericium alpestre TaxID=135208 RepID=A0A4Y9ZYW9_9AGAM|nr:hypothetical protein EWM64_g4727 [Hericium alpestre]
MEERAMSIITWLNSPQKNQLKVSTVKDQITIRQCHEQELGTAPPKYKPITPWHALSAGSVAQPSRSGSGNSSSNAIAVGDSDSDEAEWIDVAGDGETESVEIGQVDERWLNPNDASQADRNGTAEQRTSILISLMDVIDLTSLHLRAFLADTSAQPLPTLPSKSLHQSERIEVPEDLSFDSRWDE